MEKSKMLGTNVAEIENHAAALSKADVHPS
jgi:hypothetical protein